MAIRLTVVVVPVVVATVAGVVVSRLLPRAPGTWGTVLWFLGVMGASTLALVGVERQARRLLPLATLLRLTLVFPDRAPSRLGVAMRAGTVRTLERRRRRARQLAGDDPGKAAAAVLVLAAALNSHDKRTRGHSERVRGFTELVAEEMYLSNEDRNRLRWAALLHDIGKVQIDPAILNKDGPLSAEEWELIHRHPVDGARIVAPLRPWLGPWADAIEHHHERWDGRGYPHGLAGSHISLAARVVAVADAYEVMTAARSYRRPVGPAAAREELARCAGSHFDPAVVRAFLNVSLGRLRWGTAPVAWLADIPVAGPLANVATLAEGARAGMAAKLAAAVGLTLASGFLDRPDPQVPRSVAAAAEAVTGAAAPAPVPSPGAGPPATRPAPAPAPASSPLEAAGAAMANTAEEARRSAGPVNVDVKAPVVGRARAAPRAVDDVAVVPSDRAVSVDVLANDADPDGLDPKSLAIVYGPSHGQAWADKVRGTVTYESDPGYLGTDLFRYRVCDKKGACSVVTVRVTVVPR